MTGRDFSSLGNVEIVKVFSDLTLICGEESFKSNKATVCLHSPVLAAAVTGESKEAKANEIAIPFDLPSVKRMIDFMYMGDYNLTSYTASEVLSDSQHASTVGEASNDTVKADVTTGANHGDSQHPTTLLEILNSHVRVNAVAHYYGIPVLGALSANKARNVLQSQRRPWPAKIFCDFLRNSTGSTGDAQFHEMLAAITMEHIQDVVDDLFLDDIDVLRELGPYLVPKLFSQMGIHRRRPRAV
ncbi:hypothetical protein F5Y08DRAFT_147537 [Xylaria arbuscula]|nr:hypothetical protein F5Y08DRAFT_147537 [Xylaria arbuscula]